MHRYFSYVIKNECLLISSICLVLFSIMFHLQKKTLKSKKTFTPKSFKPCFWKSVNKMSKVSILVFERQTIKTH